jgi:uncharacterized membrane protein
MENNNNDQTVHHGTVENGAHKPGPNLMAIFAYLGIFIVVPFLTGSNNVPFIKFHIKQGLTLIGFYVIGWVIAIVIGWVPVLGGLITTLWAIASIIFVIVGIINVLQGQEKELPWIGHYASNFKF